MDTQDDFIHAMPKIELHVHIEGTLTPELRWQLAQKNGIKLPYDTLEALKASYATMYNHRREVHGDNGLPTFLEAYYGGMEVLQTEDDFYELAMNYFLKAVSMNIRYCEPFFDPQAHTRRGVPLFVVLSGLSRAKTAAQSLLNLHVNWIMCFLRDMPVESALETYKASLPYRHVFIGIGLDSNEYNRPPLLFDPLFRLARADGFKLTAHCDFQQQDALAHIRQALCAVADGAGLDRIDHGLDAARDPELVQLLVEKGRGEQGVGVTLCPHAYARRNEPEAVFPLIRRLWNEGVKVAVGSDDPAYMHGVWLEGNLRVLGRECGFGDAEMVGLQRNAVGLCWAGEEVKRALERELEGFVKVWGSKGFEL